MFNSIFSISFFSFSILTFFYHNFLFLFLFNVLKFHSFWCLILDGINISTTTITIIIIIIITSIWVLKMKNFDERNDHLNLDWKFSFSLVSLWCYSFWSSFSLNFILEFILISISILKYFNLTNETDALSWIHNIFFRFLLSFVIHLNLKMKKVN